MTLDDIPLLGMLKAKLGYDTRRQGLIAQNVANSETPGFAPKDLKPFTMQAAAGGAAMAVTRGGHMAGRVRGASGAGTVDAPDSEARLDGNRVVLEEQMMKMSEARADYDAAISLYQQSMAMLRTAARRPGG